MENNTSENCLSKRIARQRETAANISQSLMFNLFVWLPICGLMWVGGQNKARVINKLDFWYVTD